MSSPPRKPPQQPPAKVTSPIPRNIVPSPPTGTLSPDTPEPCYSSEAQNGDLAAPERTQQRPQSEPKSLKISSFPFGKPNDTSATRYFEEDTGRGGRRWSLDEAGMKKQGCLEEFTGSVDGFGEWGNGTAGVGGKEDGIDKDSLAKSILRRYPLGPQSWDEGFLGWEKETKEFRESQHIREAEFLRSCTPSRNNVSLLEDAAETNNLNLNRKSGADHHDDDEASVCTNETFRTAGETPDSESTDNTVVVATDLLPSGAWALDTKVLPDTASSEIHKNGYIKPPEKIPEGKGRRSLDDTKSYAEKPHAGVIAPDLLSGAKTRALGTMVMAHYDSTGMENYFTKGHGRGRWRRTDRIAVDQENTDESGGWGEAERRDKGKEVERIPRFGQRPPGQNSSRRPSDPPASLPGTANPSTDPGPSRPQNFSYPLPSLPLAAHFPHPAHRLSPVLSNPLDDSPTWWTSFYLQHPAPSPPPHTPYPPHPLINTYPRKRNFAIDHSFDNGGRSIDMEASTARETDSLRKPRKKHEKRTKFRGMRRRLGRAVDRVWVVIKMAGVVVVWVLGCCGGVRCWKERGRVWVDVRGVEL